MTGTSKRLCGFGLFDEGFLPDHDDDAGIGDVEPAAVGLGVVADFGALREADVAVDDGAPDSRMAADVDVVIDDGFGDFAVAVDADIVADDAALNAPTGDDRSASDDGIESHAHALGIGEDEFRGRILMLPGAQRPIVVIQIEYR